MRRTSQCVFPYTASWTKIRFAGISSLWSILWPISVEKKINLELLHLNSSFFILLLIFMCFFFFFLLFFFREHHSSSTVFSSYKSLFCIYKISTKQQQLFLHERSTPVCCLGKQIFFAPFFSKPSLKKKGSYSSPWLRLPLFVLAYTLRYKKACPLCNNNWHTHQKSERKYN